VKLISNPLMLRLAFALFSSAFVCVAAFFLVRQLRRTFTQNESLADRHPQAEQLPMHTYHAVIQQLKQQKYELTTTQQAERRRAKTSENLSAAVLSRLSSGVMFFTPNHLVRQANTACKSILGFASPAGMSVNELFRDATLVATRDGQPQSLAAAIQAGLRDASATETLTAHYVTPGGESRILEITMTAVSGASGEVLGTACLIDDKTEIELIQKQQELRGEMSAEMALALRSSLASICLYAEQLAAGRDPERTRQLAADIVSEATQAELTVGGFLASAKAASAARA
jgi:nitrogen fixation/metabolism regulation signal transduction histidine kinase